MKRLCSALLAVVLAVSCASFAASAETRDFGAVSTEVAESLLDAYSDLYERQDPVEYFGVLGAFDDVYVLIAVDGGWLAPAWRSLGRYTFNGYFNNYDAFCVYQGGSFTPLGEAYESGLVTDAMLDESIGKYMDQLNEWTRGIVNLLGDLNEDGTVSVSDVVLLRQRIMDGLLYYKDDINGDGEVTVSDVIALRAMIVG